MRHTLHLFGRPRLSDAAGAQVHLGPSAWRLITIAAATPEGVSRTDLVRLLWPNGKLGTLRKLVWDIRLVERAHEITILDSDDLLVHLAEISYCDVRDLCARRSEREPSRLYRGIFAEGIDASHSSWTSWITDQRERLRDIYIEKAMLRVQDVGLTRSAQMHEVKRLLEVDPANEVAVRAQMMIGALSGNGEAVERSYQGLRSRLDLVGARPENGTTDLFLRLTGPHRSGDPSPDSARDLEIPTICILKPTGGRRVRSARIVDSLVVDVSIGLCRVSLFKVIAPHTAWKVSSEADPNPLQQINADYVVETKVLEHISGKTQLSVMLYLTSSRQIIWCDKIDIDENVTVDLYNVLTAGVLRSLIKNIEDREINSFALRADPSGYVLFLKGQMSLASLDLRDLRKGRRHLISASKRSPAFAPVSSALARSYQLEWILTARGDPDLLSQSEHHARSAIQADPYEARGFRELGFCSLYRKHFDLSIENYQKAEALNPHYADIIADYADALVHDGQLEKALSKITSAIALNPLCQDTYFWTLGSAYYFLGRYSEAISALERMQDTVPVSRLLAAANALKGNLEEAGRRRIKAMETYPDMTIEGWLNIVSFRDPRQIRHYHEGLKAAGFS